jgi:hypothetical protein
MDAARDVPLYKGDRKQQAEPVTGRCAGLLGHFSRAGRFQGFFQDFLVSI